MYDIDTIPTDHFTEDPMGVCSGGTVGGDIQIGESFNRRFAMKLDNGEFTTYVASENENRFDDTTPADAWVQTQVYYCHCTDPNDVGMTEKHADYRYWDGPGQNMTTDKDARDLVSKLTVEDLNEAVNQMGV